MRVNRRPPDRLDDGSRIVCPARVHSALVNIAALIVHAVLHERGSPEKVVVVPRPFYALIGELLLWEAARITEDLPRTDALRERARAENYERLGLAIRAFAQGVRNKEKRV